MTSRGMVTDMIGLVRPGLARDREPARARAACLLSLAAAPTFATMAFFVAIHGSGAPDILCLAARDGSPLTGMVPMYVLMSGFHLPPWLQLISRRRRVAPSSLAGLYHGL
ncbi:MAG TPA: hypothetical protein VMF67_11970 [Rhizomicrobium sp.]|nr:hypothetical protein [Rhizomicrobium sp.]